jgi:hypothetical protein
VTYEERDAEITEIYAIGQDLQRELDGLRRKPAGKALKDWLEEKGCRLDCSDGPAYVRREADGWAVEEHIRNGEWRTDGPAMVTRSPQGTAFPTALGSPDWSLGTEAFPKAERPARKEPGKPGPKPV